MTMLTQSVAPVSNPSRPSDVEVAIIGGGPYGLSIAAHLKAQNVSIRIFGRLMDSWTKHMPKGMLLKSDGFASTISDPKEEFTLKHFCAQQGIEYGDTVIPVRLDTFCAYGRAFQERFVPELEDNDVVSVEIAPSGFRLRLDDGQTLTARKVVLAVGITHYHYIPEDLAKLTDKFCTHSSRYHELDSFDGKKVVVVGGGASAIDISYLLKENGANVELVARAAELKFHGKPTTQQRPLWQRLRHPGTGLGPGWRSKFYTDAPLLFRYLSESTRFNIVKTQPAPAGGWFAHEKVVGQVPLYLGHSIERAEVRGNQVHLHLRDASGTPRQIVADHVVAATGYRVDINRLEFLSTQIKSCMHCAQNTPILSSDYQCSIPGLYFVGTSAANSFGPLMRFAYGSTFAARRITKMLTKALSRERSVAPVAQVAAS